MYKMKRSKKIEDLSEILNDKKGLFCLDYFYSGML